MRKTVFCLAKGHLLRRNMPSFRNQKTVFCKTVANILNVKRLQKDVKRRLNVVTEGLPTNAKSKYFDNENN